MSVEVLDNPKIHSIQYFSSGELKMAHQYQDYCLVGRHIVSVNTDKSGQDSDYTNTAANIYFKDLMRYIQHMLMSSGMCSCSLCKICVKCKKVTEGYSMNKITSKYEICGDCYQC